MKKWIGLAEVEPVDGNDALGPGLVGAYVSVVGLSSDQDAFADGVGRFCEEMGFRLRVLDDVDDLANRLRSHTIEQRLREASEALGMDRPFAFGTFDTFPLAD